MQLPLVPGTNGLEPVPKTESDAGAPSSGYPWGLPLPGQGSVGQSSVSGHLKGNLRWEPLWRSQRDLFGGDTCNCRVSIYSGIYSWLGPWALSMVHHSAPSFGLAETRQTRSMSHQARATKHILNQLLPQSPHNLSVPTRAGSHRVHWCAGQQRTDRPWPGPGGWEGQAGCGPLHCREEYEG